MSWRSDSTQLIAGSWLSSAYAGHGIQAQDVPSTGTSGAGYLYNDIAAEGAAPTDEMRGEILTWPSAGVFTPNEDSSASLAGAPDGTYYATYRGYINGAAYGDFTITMIVGGGNTTSAISYDIGEISFAVTAASSAPVFTAAASYDIGEIQWAVNSAVIVGGNAAAVAYDIGQVDFAASASVSAPVNSAAITYDIGQIAFAVEAAAITAPSDIQATISYDIGAISFSVAIISGEINNLYGVGSGIVFIEPLNGVSFTR